MNATGPLRLFVALEPPAAALAALAEFRTAAADPAVWRPVADSALHLTLAFLGHRPAGDVAAVRTALAASAGPALELSLGGGLRLPPRRPRVLCAEVADPGGALASLRADLSARLVAAGVCEPEPRPFRAHVTVARLRSGARAPRGPVRPAPAPVAFTAEHLTLYASRSGPAGARYDPLARVALSPAVP